MNTLSPTRFGFGLAVASSLAYLGCAFVMAVVPQDTAVRFFNSIMHGVNVQPIMRWDMPLWETIVGVVELFILGWLFGAIIAGCYNLALRKGSAQSD